MNSAQKFCLRFFVTLKNRFFIAVRRVFTLKKIFAALARRGYGYAEARQALEALKDEQE